MEDLFVDLMYESPDQKDLNKIVINSDVVTKKIEPMLVFSPKSNEKIAVNKSWKLRNNTYLNKHEL